MPQLYHLDESLGFLTGRLFRLILKRNLEEFAKNGLSITSEQWMVLVHLWTQDGTNQHTITELMHKDKASMTRLISSLETKGLLIRAHSQSDGREKYVYLTDAGRTTMRLATKLVQEVLERSYSDINDEDMKTCKAVLRKAYKNLH